MAINPEIWINDIVEGFFPDNSFISRSVDHTPFVENGKTVHVPNMGNSVNITKNVTSLPASVTKRNDSDSQYTLDKYYSDPVMVEHLEAVELSYDKRSSIVRDLQDSLRNAVIEDLLYKWASSDNVASEAKIETGGSAVQGNGPHSTATSTRKKLTVADMLKMKMIFDQTDVPQEGRCLLLPATMLNELLDAMTSQNHANYMASADPVRGIVGKFMGFDIYVRSRALLYNSSVKPWDGSYTLNASDKCAALAWHPSCVARALGEVKLFEKADDPAYYGDVFSVAMHAGGSAFRSDKVGVGIIYQG